MESEKPPHVDPSPSRENSGGEFEHLLLEYIDRLNSGEMLDPEKIIREHPLHGTHLVQQLEIFHGMGRARAEPVLGTLGDYTLRRQIGRGGMGIVYEAWQNSVDRQVALKVLPAGVAVDERALQRFVREAKTAAHLSHPHIVGVYGMGVEQSTPYYAMEFVEGESLARILSRYKAGEAEPHPSFGATRDELAYYSNLAKAFADVADGLQHAHARRVVHRDIKPSNLILDREGRLRILDFGLARLEGQESLTQTGDFVGTPLYMSPEQAQVRKIPIDHRTDIYSLGATLYELLTLQPPFRGKDHQDTLSQIITRDPDPPRKHNQTIPKDLETIVLKCLRKDPRDRYGTAEALGQDLRRFVRGDPIEARAEAGWERLVRRAWRLRLRIALGGALVLAAAAAGILAWKVHQEGAARAEREYERLVVEAIESLPLDRMEDFPDQGAVGEEQREGRALLASFRILDERRLETQLGESTNKLERAARLVPGRPEARYYLVRAFRLLGDDARAEAELSRLLVQHPGFAPARALREPQGEAPSDGWGDAWLAAVQAAADRDWKRAEQAWSQVLNAAAEGEPFLGASLEVLLARGIARLESGLLEGSKRDFHAASLRWPRAILPALLLGKVYLAAGQPAEADSWLAAKHAGLSGSWQRDAFALQALQMLELSDAREFLLPWVERLEPGRARELARMHALLWSERMEEGRSARKVIEIGEDLLVQDPRDALVHALVAVAAADVVGESRRYEKHIESARILGEADPHVLTIVASLSAPEPAIELCRKILEIDPTFTPARFLLAESLVDAQRPDEAIPILEEMVRRRREPARALLLLGRAHLLKNRDSEALDLYRQALDLRPDWPFATIRVAQVHLKRGEYEEAARLYRAGIAKSSWLGNFYMLALVSLDMGRLDEALELACRSIPRSVLVPTVQHWLFENLILSSHRLSTLDPLEGFVDEFAPRLEECGDSPWVLQSMALALAHAPHKRDIPRALELAAKAVEKTGREDARFLAGLAAVQQAAGEGWRAIRTLEEACEREFFDKVHLQQLERYRKSLWPRVSSMGSVDAVLKSESGAEQLDVATVDPALSAEDRDGAAEIEAYLEACRLQRALRLAEAGERFEKIARSAADSVRPTIHWLECLRGERRFDDAVSVLKEALSGERGGDRRLWDLWWLVEVRDLSQVPGALLETLPSERPETAGRPGHRDDMFWLLGRLKAGEPLRIDCGLDEDHEEPRGAAWSRDRLYLGGRRYWGQERELAPIYQESDAGGEFLGEIHGAPYDRPFRAARHFPRLLPESGYRIPLPAGTYRVTLLFADLFFPHPGRRRFDVLLEAEKVLSNYAPNQVGFATVETRTFTVPVKDGFLDLRFKEIALMWREPFISALEIERME